MSNEFSNLEKKHKEFILSAAKTGPEKNDFKKLDEFYAEIYNLRLKNLISSDQFYSTRSWFGESMQSLKTLQGHVCMKPYGYDGDFEIIDKIYSNYHSEILVFKKWDSFFQSQDACVAVRNRKSFFINMLNQLEQGSKILNLGCGPCKDLLDYSIQNTKKLSFVNVDIDQKAIDYSKIILKDAESINYEFIKVNILKYIPDQKFDLIWSSGLFDYVNDNTFVHLIKRFVSFLKPEGKLVIGNFNKMNNSLEYMEYGDWFLNYRDENKLFDLTKNITSSRINIDYEPLKLNLFLTISAK
jgi:ubiquinone/menaquinone biosynthesis C-methylase UbiE